MKTCEEFQLAIEMKRHGALDVRAAEEAERHVAGCAECQRALADMASLDAALRPPATARPPRYEQVRKALVRERFWVKYLPWICVASFVVQGAFLGLLIAPDDPLRLWAIISAAGVVLGALVMIDFRRRRRGVVKAAQLGVSAWTEHRRVQLDNELRDLRILMWLLPLIGLGMAASAWFFDPSKLGARILFLALAASMVPVMAVVHSWYRPRLLRERAELGGAL